MTARKGNAAALDGRSGAKGTQGNTPKNPNPPKSETLQAALEYAKRGWRVFPIFAVSATGGCECGYGDCDKPGKHPAIKGWPKEATTDPDVIKSWWEEHPLRGVGIATGEESGITVLDVDGPNGVESLGKLSVGVGMPSTPTVQSRPGRYHYYFAFKEGIKSNAGKIGVGLDGRNDNGYVVAPPSRHSSGSIYTWLAQTAKLPLAPWPDFLSGKAAAGKGKVGRPPKETFNAASSQEVDRLTAALTFIDADDEERWGQVGWIMGRAFRQSDAGFAIYSAWAAGSRKYDRKRTKGHYYERSKEKPTGPVLTTGSIYKWAVEEGWDDPKPGDDHYSLSEALLAKIQADCGTRPVFTQGRFWVVDNGLWVPLSVDQVACRTGEWFRGEKFCKRGSDFKAIAQIAAQIANDDRFFESAAVGIAGPKHLWAVVDGKLTQAELKPEHRLRSRVCAEPDAKAKAPLFNALLDHAFPKDDGQRELLQLLFGSALSQRLWKYQIAVMLYGHTGSGKTVLLNLLRAMFLPELVSSVSPQRWDDEYYTAELAGKALNIVGELDPNKPIPGGAFKAVTGEDLINGRHPTHRPFSFVSTATQVFNCNRPPPTMDRSDAFFRRWRIVHFVHTVPEEKRDRDLAKKIIAQEIGAVVSWMLDGAAAASRLAEFPITDAHRELMNRWRNANNSALLFIEDREVCVREKGCGPTLGRGLFVAYRDWAAENGVKAFGRNGFYEALSEGGVLRVEVDHQPAFADVRLLTPMG